MHGVHPPNGNASHIGHLFRLTFRFLRLRFGIQIQKPLPSSPNDSGNGNAVPKNQHFCMPAISKNRTEDPRLFAHQSSRFRDTVPMLVYRKKKERRKDIE
ncbi:hypothetical protein HNY73_010394 [Argiope bruennichi]|uniref:Uncharacterized protein n=1 Tax=Argiope bruennichi TaxID=94029 RepID=A0A8T0F0T7_ARGBR|nr:hypothetical protein HNY73_010394 [Argiope bruennichi]